VKSPGGCRFVVAKSIFATALEFAWFTQAIRGLELTSSPNWTVPQVVALGVVGVEPAVIHNSDEFADT